MMKLTLTTVTGLGITAAAAILSAGIVSAPLAASAPQEPDAPSVINQLQSEGYTVNLDRLGSKALDECKVIGVRNPQTITQTNRADDRSQPLGDHRSTKIISQTISLALDCT